MRSMQTTVAGVATLVMLWAFQVIGTAQQIVATAPSTSPNLLIRIPKEIDPERLKVECGVYGPGVGITGYEGKPGECRYSVWAGDGNQRVKMLLRNHMGNGRHPGQQGIAAQEFSLQLRASGPDDWYQCPLGQNGEFALTLTAGKYYLELEALEADQTPRRRIPVREALWIEAGEQCILTLD